MTHPITPLRIYDDAQLRLYRTWEWCCGFVAGAGIASICWVAAKWM